MLRCGPHAPLPAALPDQRDAVERAPRVLHVAAVPVADGRVPVEAAVALPLPAAATDAAVLVEPFRARPAAAVEAPSDE